MTIAQVAQTYGLTADTLRYYEKIGLLPDVRRTSGGIRDYSESDCQWVGYIKCMRGAGVSVDTLVEYVRLFHQGNETIAQRKQLLIQQRAQIQLKVDELVAALQKLDWKIEGYEERMVACEKALS